MVGRSKIRADGDERAALRLLARSGHRAEADRARAILLTLEGREAAGIAAALGVHVSTVREWRGLFTEGCCEGSAEGEGEARGKNLNREPCPVAAQPVD